MFNLNILGAGGDPVGAHCAAGLSACVIWRRFGQWPFVACCRSPCRFLGCVRSIWPGVAHGGVASMPWCPSLSHTNSAHMTAQKSSPSTTLRSCRRVTVASAMCWYLMLVANAGGCSVFWGNELGLAAALGSVALAAEVLGHPPKTLWSYLLPTSTWVVSNLHCNGQCLQTALMLPPSSCCIIWPGSSRV